MHIINSVCKNMRFIFTLSCDASLNCGSKSYYISLFFVVYHIEFRKRRKRHTTWEKRNKQPTLLQLLSSSLLLLYNTNKKMHIVFTWNLCKNSNTFKKSTGWSDVHLILWTCTMSWYSNCTSTCVSETFVAEKYKHTLTHTYSHTL